MVTRDIPILYTSTGIGEVIATDISEDEYMEKYAAYFCEWINGVVIRMTPVHIDHDRIDRYLAMLLEAYLTLKPIGSVVQAPFVMRTEPGKSRREPDIQVILGDNQKNMTHTMMDGAADIVIEIVSPESEKRDYGEKFHEYEAGGVQEYWIIDPHQKQARFYRLEDGVYIFQKPDSNQIYQTPVLPELRVEVDKFWQRPLPDFFAIGDSVRAMLNESK
ncbi:MAG: Uma2 family endonuclease [Aggregatilineales bacterium]